MLNGKKKENHKFPLNVAESSFDYSDKSMICKKANDSMAYFEHYQLYFQRVSNKIISISAIWSYLSYVCIGIKLTSLRNMLAIELLNFYM